MTLTLPTALALAAVIGAVLLLFHGHDRTLAAVAAAVGAVELLRALGILHFSISGLHMGLLLGGALAVVGFLLCRKVSARADISAATVVCFVGTIQLLESLGVV